MYKALIVKELVEAYKCLVKITAERMTAEQHGNLLMVERHLALALQHAASRGLERGAVTRFIEKMMRREQGVEGP